MGVFDSFFSGKATDRADPPAKMTPTTAAIENDHVIASYLVWSLARPPIGIKPATGVSSMPDSIDDVTLVSRVQAAYRAAAATFESSGSFWDTTIGEIRRPVHQALLSCEPATTILRDPARNTHFWGFDAICQAPDGQTEPHEVVMKNMQSEGDWRSLYAKWLHDGLVSLAAQESTHLIYNFEGV